MSQERDILYLELNPYAIITKEVFKDTRSNKLYKAYPIQTKNKVHCMTWPFPRRSLFITEHLFTRCFVEVTREEAEEYKSNVESSIREGTEHYLSV